MSGQTVVRWGILATGGIARTFTKDLLIDPTTRGTTDIIHQVTAAASSSALQSAEEFVSEVVAPRQKARCSAYGSYADLVKDQKIDIVYIATPHSHHYQNVMLCLEAGKAVLCEKAFTVNAEQARRLCQTARQKKLFLMEAVKTRYSDCSRAIRKHIMDGDLGEVLRVNADFSIGTIPEESFEVSHRMINMDLAGGCLLDLGIYSLTWVFQTLYHTLPREQRQAPKVKGVAMTPEPRTGADEMTTIMLEFPKSTPSGQTTAHAVATTALRVDDDPDKHQSAGPTIRIQGTKGEIQVYGSAHMPTRYKLIPVRKGSKEGKGEAKDYNFDIPGGGSGMFWEADEAARCWRDAALESDGLSWEESILIMEIMDEVRRQGGLEYPSEIESIDYPVDLKSKQP